MGQHALRSARQVAVLRVGDEVHELESRVNDKGVRRVRFGKGWVSEKAAGTHGGDPGTVILEFTREARKVKPLKEVVAIELVENNDPATSKVDLSNSTMFQIKREH